MDSQENIKINYIRNILILIIVIIINYGKKFCI